MSPLPWLPSGSTELPAARFLLFADDSHVVQRIDESALQLNGVSFTGVWESHSLNGQEIIEKTLRHLTMTYLSPSSTTMTVKASGNGGDTWALTKTVTIVASTGKETKRAQIGLGVTGYDLRIRLEIDTNTVFHIYQLHPVVARRGEYVS